MLQIFRKEINSFFNSLVAYMVLITFLVLVGLLVWVFPQSSILNGKYANLDPLFMIAPYVFMFLIPAITMRTFAEEKKAGTMELLLTRPLSDASIVWGKLLSSWSLALFALIPTIIYYFTVYELGTPKGNLDTAAVIGSYIGLIFLAGVYTAIGVFSSSLSDNQIVAFLLAVFFCFTLYDGFTSLAAINVWSDYAYIISQLGIDYHYSSISRGLIDFRDVLYFISLLVGIAGLTQLVLASRKW